MGATGASASDQPGSMRPDKMGKEKVERYIRERKQNTRSIDDQIAILHGLKKENIGPDHDGIKANDIEDELGLDLDFAVRTSLGHLEDIDLVEEFLPPGPKVLVIAEWMDGGTGEIVNGEVEEAAREGLDALADDLNTQSSGEGAATAADGSGITLRSVVASELDLVPDKVEEHLRSTSRAVDDLNALVDAIKEADGIEVGDGYGNIVFINMPYRYRLTEKAIDLYDS